MNLKDTLLRYLGNIAQSDYQFMVYGQNSVILGLHTQTHTYTQRYKGKAWLTNKSYLLLIKNDARVDLVQVNQPFLL